MEKTDFFQSLGFNEYESKTLVSFAKLNSATAKQISQDSQVPQNKLYQLIKKFENLGILSLIPGESKKYKILNLKTFIEQKIKEKEKEIKEIKKASKNLNKLNKNSKEFIFTLIKGQKAIMNTLAEKNPKVEKEILAVQRNWKVWGEGLRSMQKSIKNGVKVKMIGIINDKTKERAEEWKKIGCKIHPYNYKFGENPLRFSIFDNKEARITIGSPEIQNPEDYITFWTTSKPLIAILIRQFEEMWNER